MKLQKLTDIADRLQVSVRTVYRLPGFPAPIRMGRLVRWREEDVDAWIAERSGGAVKRPGRPRSTRSGV
jgi:predicted DNA-binding transcriptional regulator AlpA